ncbi:MAG TPA: hypothetical protein ENF76_06410 [Candidatus Bathyarchaeota archaeon]|nr:hypothetical protein [Candidatus Bathyarchaeota archaeon]
MGTEARTVEDNVALERLHRDSIRYLKESISICVEELRKPEVESKTKVQWARCLAQQIAALMKISRMTASDTKDLASWLSEIKRKIPKKYVEKELFPDLP